MPTLKVLFKLHIKKGDYLRTITTTCRGCVTITKEQLCNFSIVFERGKPIYDNVRSYNGISPDAFII